MIQGPETGMGELNNKTWQEMKLSIENMSITGEEFTDDLPISLLNNSSVIRHI